MKYLIIAVSPPTKIPAHQIVKYTTTNNPIKLAINNVHGSRVCVILKIKLPIKLNKCSFLHKRKATRERIIWTQGLVIIEF